MPRRRFQSPSVERRKCKRPYFFVRFSVYQRENGHEVRRQKSKFLGYCPTVRDPIQRKLRGEITKREAERMRNEIMAVVNGQANVPTAAQVKLNDFLDRFEAEYVPCLAAPTQLNYRCLLRAHVRPQLGDKQLGDLTTELLQAWINRAMRKDLKQAAPLSSAGKSQLRKIMHVVFRAAQDWGYWQGVNPVDRVRIGKRSEVYERKLLTDAQAERLIAELDERDQLLMAVIRATGCRISEVLGLEWSHFDLTGEAGWVSFEQRRWRNEIGPVKSVAGKRAFALGPRLTARLKAIAGEGRVFDTSQDALRYELKTAARRLNLYFKGFGFHSFRREFLTKIQEVGATSIEASLVGGHTRPVMTQRYTIVQQKRMVELAKKLEGGNVVEIRGVSA